MRALKILIPMMFVAAVATCPAQDMMSMDAVKPATAKPAAKSAPAKIPPLIREVTYRAGGAEHTRFFAFFTDKAGAQTITESAGPDAAPEAKVAEPLGKDSEKWMMSLLGFERTSIAPGAPAGTDVIMGPDGDMYERKFIDAPVPVTTGPHGEQVVRVVSWTRGGGGWDKTLNQLDGQRTPSVSDAEKSWRAGPQPPTRKGSERKSAAPVKQDTMAPAEDGMMMMNSGEPARPTPAPIIVTSPPSKKDSVSAAEKARMAKLEELSKKQAKARSLKEQQRLRDEREKRRKKTNR